jgi:hypothetical protein
MHQEIAPVMQNVRYIMGVLVTGDRGAADCAT